MARRSYQRHYNRRGGYERALQHIREGEQLSRELGGTDEDVKRYFFALPADKLRVILDEYEQKHGSSPREYAEKTIAKWKSGRTKMSGTVAARLYALLPPRMPLQSKYELIKALWEQHSPRSHKVLRIGPDAEQGQVIDAVRAHIFHTITSYEIPAPLGQRFQWLSMGDASVQQEILNHFLDLEKRLAVEGTKMQVPVMLKHLRESGDKLHRLNQRIEIGKHKFDLTFDLAAKGATLEEPQVARYSSKTGSDWTWLFWLAAIGAALFLFFG